MCTPLIHVLSYLVFCALDCMGSCISLDNAGGGATQVQTTKVVTPSGQLRQYSDRITAVEALVEPLTFLCSSDLLFVDEPIPALPRDHLLHLGQVYFALPDTMLGRALTVDDMKTLAWRTSGAMAEAERATAESRKREKKVRVFLFLEEDIVVESRKSAPAKATRKVAASMKRLQRSASRKAKLAARSFKMRLSTIHEEALAA